MFKQELNRNHFNCSLIVINISKIKNKFVSLLTRLKKLF